MILLDKEQLYNTFRADSFFNLSSIMECSAPSLVEYYLSDLENYGVESYLNKRDIENSISFGDFNIYIDYSQNVYLEHLQSDSSETTNSFW